MRTRLFVLARPIMLVTASALFVVLFLDWRAVSIRTGMVDIQSGTWGWSGWGVLAGALLIAYVVADLVTQWAVLVPVLAVLAAAFTAVAFFAGSASVAVGGVVAVEAGQLLWPAYVGLGLAAVLGAGGLVRLIGAARPVSAWTRRPTRSRIA